MAEPEKLVMTATNLMRMALACLDEAGESDAAIHLQHAVDVLNKVPKMEPGDELPDELIERYLAPRRRH